MKIILSALWQFMNMPIDFGDIVFKFKYLLYLVIALFLFRVLTGRGGANVDS